MQCKDDCKSSAPAPKKAATGRLKRSRGRPGANNGAVDAKPSLPRPASCWRTCPRTRSRPVLIARKAGVDPALVRYYFSNRDELLFAVIEHILASWAAKHPLPDAAPAEKLSVHIANMFDFSCRMRSMQRLMVDGSQKRSPPRYARACAN